MEWEVSRNYTFEEEWLVPVGRPVRSYDPLEYPEVVGSFAGLRYGDRRELERFARWWGLPGWYKTQELPAGEQARPRDLAPAIWQHARFVMEVLQIYYLLQKEDWASLAQLLVSGTPVVQSGMPKKSVEALRLAGEERIAAVVNQCLAEVSGGVRYQLQTNPLRLVRDIPSLILAIYWHLAEIVSSKQPVANCEECGNFFLLTHGRQKYCPPLPAWKRPTESRCSMRARKRTQRAKTQAAREDALGEE